MPFIEERERVSRIIGERCRSGPRNVPESNLGRSDPQQTSEGAAHIYIHIQKSQQSELLGLLVLYRKEEKRITSLSLYAHIHSTLPQNSWAAAAFFKSKSSPAQ